MKTIFAAGHQGTFSRPNPPDLPFPLIWRVLPNERFLLPKRPWSSEMASPSIKCVLQPVFFIVWNLPERPWKRFLQPAIRAHFRARFQQIWHLTWFSFSKSARNLVCFYGCTLVGWELEIYLYIVKFSAQLGLSLSFYVPRARQFAWIITSRFWPRWCWNECIFPMISLGI